MVKSAALADSVTSSESQASVADQAFAAVVTLVEQAPSPSGDDFFAAIEQLKQLTWADLRSVVLRLSQSGPSLDGMT